MKFLDKKWFIRINKWPLDIEKLNYKSFEGFLIKQGGTF